MGGWDEWTRGLCPPLGLGTAIQWGGDAGCALFGHVTQLVAGGLQGPALPLTQGTSPMFVL